MPEMIMMKMLVVMTVMMMGQAGAMLRVPGLVPSRYEVLGDINIGVLVDITHKGDRSKGEEHCEATDGSDIHNARIHLCEAAVFAAQKINARQDLLPNISLGVVCMDTCDNLKTSLAQSVYMVKDHPSPGWMAAPQQQAEIPDDELKHEDVVGVIGPIANDEAVLVSSFLGLFHIPVMGTYATSDELSDKERYEYFLRLQSPDRFQAQALVDLVLYFGWEYIGLFYTEGSYGEYGAKQVLSLVAEHDLCLAYSYRISTKYSLREEEEVLELFDLNPNLKAIIWFAEGENLRNIFGAVARRYPEAKAIYLFSMMSGYMPVLYRNATVGSFSVGTSIGHVPDFLDYFTSLIPGNNTHNPWLKMSWQATFDCDWDATSNNSCNNYRADSSWYGFIPIITPYYDGTNVYANALHNLIAANCPDAFTNKSLLSGCIEGPDLLREMKNSTIEGASGNIISFNEDGDMLGSYRVRQYQWTPDGSVHSIVLGVWDKLQQELIIDDLKVNMTFLRTSTDDPHVGYYKTTASGGEVFIAHSVCSWPCGAHEFKIQQKVACCWECRRCRDNEVVKNYTSCMACPEFTWPDKAEPSQCTLIEPRFLQWKDPAAITLTCFSIIGMGLTVLLMVVIWMNRGEKLVKASNKELSFVIQFGALVACASSITFITKPSKGTCLFRNVSFNLAVNLLYAPMFVKTCRVYRIFTSGRKGLKKPLFISSMAQSVMASLSILGQVVLLMCIEIISPSVTQLYMPVATEEYVELKCSQDLVPFLLPLSYNVIFILVCAVLGYTSRNLPENFNESGFIFISVSTTLFAWVVMLPTYFTAAHSHDQAAILGLCLLLNAYITLGFLFGPKVYALYCIKEEDLMFATMTMKTSHVSPGTQHTITHVQASSSVA